MEIFSKECRYLQVILSYINEPGTCLNQELVCKQKHMLKNGTPHSFSAVPFFI